MFLCRNENILLNSFIQPPALNDSSCVESTHYPYAQVTTLILFLHLYVWRINKLQINYYYYPNKLQHGNVEN